MSVVPAQLGLAFGALVVALLVLTYALVAPRRPRVSRARLSVASSDEPGLLTRSTDAVTELIDRLMRRRGAGGTVASALEQAGLAMRTQDMALLVVVGFLVTGAVGTLLFGLLGLLLAPVAPMLVKVYLSLKAGRRRAAFADQLDDSLGLLASSLRAGHSLLQAVDAVSKEAEEPTASEFSRIINETRVGRPLAQALDETCARMGSDDFVWVSQAIAINREVGGNLAEVLDGVGHTIRERNQIRRQVQALSAEGKLSAYVLLALPVGIGGFLYLTTPAYIGKLTQSLAGYGLIVAAAVLMVVGTLWMRKVVRITF
ncbi:MAG: type II secretion system F family protein [Ornithinimicrobium sp.]|uniref:type II secretion system F family protein n=1 Tax=Ornithinimicrobium sp. TaxID=1977084 RepID=UPI00184A18C8|nr:type II secretion system F family protein [Actinomycetota bacterium]